MSDVTLMGNDSLQDVLAQSRVVGVRESFIADAFRSGAALAMQDGNLFLANLWWSVANDVQRVELEAGIQGNASDRTYEYKPAWGCAVSRVTDCARPGCPRVFFKKSKAHKYHVRQCARGKKA